MNHFISKSKNVTEALMRDHNPMITFRVDGSDLCGMGEYDPESGDLSAIVFWGLVILSLAGR